MSENHLTTCICKDCLPGGKREHRVRPWPTTVIDCEHIDYEKADGVTRAKSRLRVPLMGGGCVEQCRLCGKILRQETPSVTEEPT